MPRRIDKTSAAYKKELWIVSVVVLVLTLSGGIGLGLKIASAERAIASGEMQQVREQERGEVPGPEHGIYSE